MTAVQLYLSGEKFVSLKREDNSTATQSIANLLNVGDLRPGEIVQLSIWSASSSTSLRSADVRLTHASGVGHVVIPRLVTGLPALIDKYQAVLYGLLFIIFAGLVMQLFLNRLSKRKAI